MLGTSKTLFAALILSAGFMTGQTANSQIPAREKLNYFAGAWTLEIHMNTGAFGSRPFIGTEHNEWLADRSLLVSRPDGDIGMVAGGLTVLGYNPGKSTYTYHVVKSSGETEDLTGTLEGNTWTWISDGSSTHDHVPKTRLTMREISSTCYTLQIETSSTGQEWSTVLEGSVNKIVPHNHQDVAFRR